MTYLWLTFTTDSPSSLSLEALAAEGYVLIFLSWNKVSSFASQNLRNTSGTSLEVRYCCTLDIFHLLNMVAFACRVSDLCSISSSSLKALGLTSIIMTTMMIPTKLSPWRLHPAEEDRKMWLKGQEKASKWTLSYYFSLFPRPWETHLIHIFILSSCTAQCNPITADSTS